MWASTHEMRADDGKSKNGKKVGRQKRIEYAKRKTMHCRSGKRVLNSATYKSNLLVHSNAIHDITSKDFCKL